MVGNYHAARVAFAPDEPSKATRRDWAVHQFLRTHPDVDFFGAYNGLDEALR